MKGICFTEPHFHKVVKGEKTQTRRIITPEPKIQNGWIVKPKSKYKVGEIVYLKEPYILYEEKYQESKTNPSGIQYAYKYGNHLPIDEITGDSSAKWKNKFFMPESAARYFIKITAVRAEKLQDISNEDCIKEGVESYFNVLFQETRYKDYLNPNSEFRYPSSSYATLINKINGKGTWESNPWVWVYDFELINK